MTTEEFISLCDDVPAMASSHSTNSRNFEIGVRLSDSTLPQMPYQEVLKLKTAFIYLSIIDDQNRGRYEKYFYILEKVSTYFNGATKEIVAWSEQVWKDVISYVKHLPEYPKSNAFNHEEYHKQERERAFAAKRLINYGLQVTIQDNELSFENEETVISLIESLAAGIGGVRAIELMLHDETYSSLTGRINIQHGGNRPMPSMVELEKPYGYLLNLFLKHISHPTTSRTPKADYEKLEDIATDFCLAIYDAQKFDIWADLAAISRDIVDFVQRMVIRFDLYTLPQTGASFTATWCRYLVKQISINPICNQVMKQQLSELVKVMNWAIANSQHKLCVVLMKTDKRASILNKLPEALRKLLVGDAASVNQHYANPIDYRNINYMFHPIYATQSTYILLPTPLVVWNWYEIIYNIIKRNTTLASTIGYIIEDFLHDKMHSHGIVTHTGDYSYADESGDVDLLVETTTGDALIECKKKALSLNARKGDSHFIWGDLKEVLESQMQCAKAENGVRNNSPLSLTKNGHTYDYNWTALYNGLKDNGTTVQRDRIISRVTLTLKEYGPMQDKLIISNIIRHLIGKEIGSSFSSGSYSADDIKNIKNAFTEINKILADLSRFYASIGLDHPTFFCRFYSLEQLYFLIRNSSDADQFFKLLAKDYCSTGTENFWNEFDNLERLRQQA